jgi:exoribonuclease-2
MPTESVDLVAIARAAMRQRGLEPQFPPAALAQAAAVPGPAPGDGLRDLRELPWCSIDNDDSMDLDQLTVAEQASDGVHVRVAIADVDALVQTTTPIDNHAGHNTTSVYTPTHVFPMLPDRLSTNLTSLAPGEDRVAVILAFTVGPDGEVSRDSVSRALVRNKAKLAYEHVAAWLDGAGPPPDALVDAGDGMAGQLRVQDEAAHRLRARRERAGALEFDPTEGRPIVVDGRVVGLRASSKNRARRLIEDFMIEVNGVAARVLEARGLPSIRRVVGTPTRWPRLQALAAETGDALPDAPEPRALAAFLSRRRAADPQGFADLSLSVLKLLGRGEYMLTRPSEEGIAHFALAVPEYVHSTAPNRRYPDLITQRLLKAAIGDAPSPYTHDTLHALAQHCTRQEDAADKVERQLRKAAAALVLSRRIGDRFTAIVTGASRKATWVRTVDPPTEGRLLDADPGLDVGEHVTVRLQATGVARGFIDFVVAD